MYVISCVKMTLCKILSPTLLSTLWNLRDAEIAPVYTAILLWLKTTVHLWDQWLLLFYTLSYCNLILLWVLHQLQGIRRCSNFFIFIDLLRCDWTRTTNTVVRSQLVLTISNHTINLIVLLQQQGLVTQGIYLQHWLWGWGGFRRFKHERIYLGCWGGGGVATTFCSKFWFVGHTSNGIGLWLQFRSD